MTHVLVSFTGSRGGLLKQGMTFDEYSRQFQASLINNKSIGGDYHPRITGKPTFSRDLTIPHLDLSHFALCIMGN